jgi:hypothetical protein
VDTADEAIVENNRFLTRPILNVCGNGRLMAIRNLENVLLPSNLFFTEADQPSLGKRRRPEMFIALTDSLTP